MSAISRVHATFIVRINMQECPISVGSAMRNSAAAKQTYCKYVPQINAYPQVRDYLGSKNIGH